MSGQDNPSALRGKELVLLAIFVSGQLLSKVEARAPRWVHPDWNNKYPEFCGGYAQSPVDIDDCKAVAVPTLNAVPFTFNEEYLEVPERMTVVNRGIKVSVSIPDKKRREVSGAGLDGVYVLHCMHLHFGKNISHGAEHLKHGHRYPSEIHLVHYNARYSDIHEAKHSNRRDAIAVFGVWIDIKEDACGFPDIFSNVSGADIRSIEKPVDIEPFSIRALLPLDTLSQFYRYYGSMTTPTCEEIVVWTVFKNPIATTEHIMQKMYQVMVDTDLISPCRGPLYRPVQPLNGRVILKSMNSCGCTFSES